MSWRGALFKKWAVAAASVMLLSFPSLASANVSVGGQSASLTGPIQVVQGAQATIVTPNNYPSITGSEMTTAWSAVGNYTTMTIAQTGFAFEPDLGIQDPHYFFGWMPNSSTYHEVTSTVGPARGSSHVYIVKKSSSGYWEGYVGSTLISSTNASIAPNCIQYYNENDSSSTSYIGTSTDKMKIESVTYWDGSASSSDMSKWVWKKPTLTFTNDTGSSISTSNWSSSGYWYSWDT
ncbi:hypothetical protein [Cohnella silvisoli]|uniref:Uncharacterized protein n=1 Tax=Cohnella silvisoli TaxID=2873699 RepID=A0ABV1KQA5_9BACL|nr:hypothetical protein [Cohnella silvisoli]MCD9022087.1 hypothetical protein [Cohnella silvisoli]